MVTENLQRKDIDPFDEADAYHALLGRGYDADSLAAKFGKSATYILSRIKLNSLIPEFREKYERGLCNFSHCNILSRVSSELQKSLLPRFRGDNRWDDLAGSTAAALKAVIRGSLPSLKNAVFDTTACRECPGNTRCSQLFGDDGVSSCQDAGCFNRKSAECIAGWLESVRSRVPDLWIADESDFNRRASEVDRQVHRILCERGFTFRKLSKNVYSFRVDGSMDFGIAYEGGDFPVEGYSILSKLLIGPERTCSGPAPHKSDWELDCMAEDLAGTKDGFRVEAAAKYIGRMSGADIKNALYAAGDQKLLKLILSTLVSLADDDVRCMALEGGMDRRKASSIIDTLQPYEVREAILRLVCGMGEDHITRSYLENIFPEVFSSTEPEARGMFYARARRCWIGYDREIAEKEIDEDLAERAERLAKEEGGEE